MMDICELTIGNDINEYGHLNSWIHNMITKTGKKLIL